VFAGREATAVAAWMRAHPSIEIAARDRAGAYSEAVDIALPAAKQVSDRWHLLCNLATTSKGCCTDSGRNCAKPRSKSRSVA
jgi:transposase